MSCSAMTCMYSTTSITSRMRTAVTACKKSTSSTRRYSTPTSGCGWPRICGARFAILTASHETGFRLWQSDANPYCLKAVQWGEGKRDIVAEFIASCRRFDIQPGIYLGTRWNAQLGVWDFKVTQDSPVTQENYNRLIEKEVEEICTRYGPLFELWFDGGAHGPKQGGPDVLGVFEKTSEGLLVLPQPGTCRRPLGGQ